METYLTHLYGSDQSSNYFGYSTPGCDDLLKQGDSAATVEEAIGFYQQAEDAVSRHTEVEILRYAA